MVKMITLKQQELNKGHLRGQRIVSMYRRTPCSRWKSPTTAPLAWTLWENMETESVYKDRGINIWRRNLGISKEKANSLHANLIRERVMRVWNQFWAKTPKSLVMMIWRCWLGRLWWWQRQPPAATRPLQTECLELGTRPAKKEITKAIRIPRPARWEITKAIRIWNCTPTQHPIIDYNNNWTQQYRLLSSTPSSMPGATPPAPLAAARSMAPWCGITLISFFHADCYLFFLFLHPVSLHFSILATRGLIIFLSFFCLLVILILIILLSFFLVTLMQ